MRPSRPIAVLAGLAAIALATVGVASPAAAATLPDGQRITVALNSGAFASDDTAQLFEVNPATAAGTAVGTPSVDPASVYAIDVDDDGHGYVTGAVRIDEATVAATLWAVDATTGTFGSSVTINIPMIGSNVFCPGLDYSGGQVYITCIDEDFEEGTFVTILGTVNPATGDVDVILAIEGEGEGGQDIFTEFTALAMSPAGVLWAFGYDETAPFAAIVDLTNETLGTRVPIVDNDDEPIHGADFDRNGQLFASVDPDGDGLATVNLSTGVVTPVGAYPFANPFQSSRAITVWGKPALAATGSAGSELVLPVGLGSALLLLAGAAFIATARMQRRTA